MKTFIFLAFFSFVFSLQAQRADFNEIDFAKAENIANRYKGESLTNLPELAYNLTSQLDTEAERFRAIYYWVTHNIKGNYGLMHKNERTRKKMQYEPENLTQWNRQFKKEVFKKLTYDKETLCSGYTYLIKVLAELADLECEIVDGYGDSDMKINKIDLPNHSWSAIKLDGKWYLCDPTWAAGYTDMLTYLFKYEYDNSYFLMKPSEFVKTHKPLEEKWTLLTIH